MFLEMLWALMLAALGLYVIYIKNFKSAVPVGGASGRYRDYRMERFNAFVESIRRAVLKYPYQARPEDSPGLYPGRCLRQ